MLSRGSSLIASLLRASESRVFTVPTRGLHTVNGRALRPVSFVLSRGMSNQEASSTTGGGLPTLHRVSALDRFTLIATRTMAPPIPADVQTATMERANSRRRIGVNGIMILLTLGACLWIIKTSQKGRDENTLVSLHERNVQRYEKLREQDAAAAAQANSEKE